MSTSIDTFPHRDLAYKEHRFFRTVLGGERPSQQRISFFFKNAGKPIFEGNLPLATYLARSHAAVAEAVSMEPRHVNTAFMAGSLLYAGVYRHTHGTSQLTVPPHALHGLHDTAPMSFMLRSREGMLDKKAFHDLLSRILLALEVDAKLDDLAVAAAGSVNLAVLASETTAANPYDVINDQDEIDRIETMLTLEDFINDPGMAELNAAFADLG